jgi:hypothetical protein
MANDRNYFPDGRLKPCLYGIYTEPDRPRYYEPLLLLAWHRLGRSSGVRRCRVWH